MALPSLGLRRRLTLRWRLVIAVATILVLALAGLFVAVYRGTGSQVRAQIDSELRRDVRTFTQTGLPRGNAPPAVVATAARAYAARQPPFGAAARLVVVLVAGGPAISNEPELVGLRRDPASERESAGTQRHEATALARIERLAPGFTTLELTDAGRVRLLSETIRRSGRPLVRFVVGEPAIAIHRAQEGVARTFLLAGVLTLLAALVAAALVAGRIAAPLRRITRTAAEVDAGVLSHRIAFPPGQPRDEVRALGDAFDHMLDRLERAFAREREFVAEASHELKTPLTIVRGQLDVLSRQADPGAAEIERVAGVVGSEVDRMERLVEDLLSLARAESGEPLARAPLRLAPFIAELVARLEPTAPDRRWETAVPSELVVLADAERLAQVIRNVVRNAVAHTSGGGLVRISATDGAGAVSIAIDDDGPGIPAADQARVFDRFHRAGVARERGRVGLGLAIARAIVEAHGGSIVAATSPAGGARILISLPGRRAR